MAMDDLLLVAAGYPSGAVGVVMFLLIISYVIKIGLVNYVYGNVVATLAIVEDPAPTAVLRTELVDEDPDAPLPPYTDREEDVKDVKDVKEPLIRQEVLLIKNKPVTTSLRGTIRHLRSRGAHPLRGLKIALMYCFFTHLITTFVTALIPMNIAAYGLAFIASQVVLTRIALLWTHMVISEPSEKRWYERIVDRKVAKKAVLPTFLAALSQVAIPMVPVCLFGVLGLDQDLAVPVDKATDAMKAAVALKAIIVSFVTLAYVIVVVVPVAIALVRCYAALLPEHETPIVSMDRTFNGYFVSEQDGGSGRLTLRAAWKSFDWNGRVRLVKVWLKTVGIIAFITFTFMLTMGAVVGFNIYLQTRQ